MQVLRMAILDARAAAWQSDIDSERLGDLMDAIHNIPAFVQHWENCNQEQFMATLLAYEKKWGRRHGPCLRTIYEQALVDVD